LSGVIDVAVVGAGPAGLAAGGLGCEVTLIDAGSGPGGQMYRPACCFPAAARAAAWRTTCRRASPVSGGPGRFATSP